MKTSSILCAGVGLLLAACTSVPPQNGETTPGIDAFFTEFTKCQTDIFQHVAANRATYASLGPIAPLENLGDWFAVKPKGGDSSELIYRFDKPLKVNGMTIMAAAYDFMKSPVPGTSFGDSTYWGFYFAENAKIVHANLSKFPAVAQMRVIMGDFADMSIHDKDAIRTEQGALLSDDSSQPNAKSYFSCTIQISYPGRK